MRFSSKKSKFALEAAAAAAAAEVAAAAAVASVVAAAAADEEEVRCKWDRELYEYFNKIMGCECVWG